MLKRVRKQTIEKARREGWRTFRENGEWWAIQIHYPFSEIKMCGDFAALCGKVGHSTDLRTHKVREAFIKEASVLALPEYLCHKCAFRVSLMLCLGKNIDELREGCHAQTSPQADDRKGEA